MEDLNYLLRREQEELVRAEAATDAASRAAHLALARGYAARIARHEVPYRTPVTGSTPFNPAPFGAEAGA